MIGINKVTINQGAVSLQLTCIDAFTIEVWWNFDKTQIIFKAITESPRHAFWWERTILVSVEMLVWYIALESISPGKDTYTTVHLGAVHYLAKRTFQGSDQLCGLCNRFFSCHTVPHLPSHQKAWPKLPVIALNMICTLSKFQHTSIVKASISGNRAWANQQNSTLFSYLRKSCNSYGSVAIWSCRWYITRAQTTSHASLETFAHEQIM